MTLITTYEIGTVVILVLQMGKQKHRVVRQLIQNGVRSQRVQDWEPGTVSPELRPCCQPQDWNWWERESKECRSEWSHSGAFLKLGNKTAWKGKAWPSRGKELSNWDHCGEPHDDSEWVSHSRDESPRQVAGVLQKKESTPYKGGQPSTPPSPGCHTHKSEIHHPPFNSSSACRHFSPTRTLRTFLFHRPTSESVCALV